MARKLLALLVVAAACGRSDSGKPAPAAKREDGAGSATVAAPTAQATVPPLEIGHASLQAAAGRDKTAIEVYTRALALAGKGGTPSEVIGPLTEAVEHDFGFLGFANIVGEPGLKPFFSTSLGGEWRRRLEEARREWTAMLSRALFVIAEDEVFAIDVHGEARRWHRITRTDLDVHGVLRVRGASQLAYVTRGHAIGVVDLSGRTGRETIALPGTPTAVRLAYNKKRGSFVVRAGKTWFALEDKAGTLSLAAMPAKQAGYVPDFADRAWLDLTADRIQLTRLDTPDVKAEWDERTWASAIKLDNTNRVINAPSIGLIDGSSLVWSPDRSQLAFVVMLTDECNPGEPISAAYVAEVTTGTMREIDRALHGSAIEWIGDRQVAVAGDSGVFTRKLDGGEPTPVLGASSLLTPKRTLPCPIE